MPSLSGKPKPGERVIAKDGVSICKHLNLYKINKVSAVIQFCPMTYIEHLVKWKHFVSLLTLDVPLRIRFSHYGVLYIQQEVSLPI